MQFDPAIVRKMFPALAQDSIYLDNPGGTQIAQSSLDRIVRYLIEMNANHGGAFPTAEASDAMLAEAHAAAADFLGARSPDEVAFGANMTTLTFAASRALGLLLQPGDEIVVTRLDHDANISPWLRVAQDRGCKVRWVDFNPADCTLDLADLRSALAERPRLVAFGYASNAVGTINPAAEIIQMAHDAGALVYVDAVQFAPHGLIDVQQLGCDFLACSAYKFFGPHVGLLYGKYDLLDQLNAYKVRPAPQLPPGKFETGTQNHEGIAGVLGAIEYLVWLGETFGGAAQGSSRRESLSQAMRAIHQSELALSQALIETLQSMKGVKVYGITDLNRLDQRVPTVSFTVEGFTPRQVAGHLGKAKINVWDGNFYALAVTERLGLEGSGGLVRVGATHYNTLEEIEAFGRVLGELVR